MTSHTNQRRGAQRQDNGGRNRPPYLASERSFGGRRDGQAPSTARASHSGRGGPSGPPKPLIYRPNSSALELPPHLSDPVARTRMQQLQSLDQDPERPLRPDLGTMGSSSLARSNIFLITLDNATIYDYSVDIQPAEKDRRLKARIFSIMEKADDFAPYIKHVAHDASQRLVSKAALPQPLSFQIPFYEDHDAGPTPNSPIYTVSITFSASHKTNQLNKFKDGDPSMRNVDIQPLISALDLILQQRVKCLEGAVEVGRNRYFLTKGRDARPLGGGLEAMQGFYVSFRPFQGRLAVNINTCMAAFVRPGNLAERLEEVKRESKGALPSALVKNLRVRLTHLGRRHKKLEGIGSLTPRDQKFDHDTYGEISVEDYYYKEYQVKLAHHDLPVVNFGSSKKPKWVPPELCEIERGSAYLGPLNHIQTTNMLNNACKPPHLWAKTIVEDGLPTLGISPNDSLLESFGVKVDSNMLVHRIRRLPPPRVQYKGKQENVPNGGWYLPNESKFITPCTIVSWGAFVIIDTPGGVPNAQLNAVPEFLKRLSETLSAHGAKVPQNPPKPISLSLLDPRNDPTRARSIQLVRDAFAKYIERNGRPSLMFVFLQHDNAVVYSGIKKIGDCELGIQTSCLQLDKSIVDFKKQNAYLANVVQKINAKLGGVNHTLDPKAMAWLTKESTMMVGIDVTHPSPGSEAGSPSILAVVANIDKNFGQFHAGLALQRSKREIDEESSKITDMMVERLQAYKKHNGGALPKRVMIFRDGVSEGQYDLLREFEKPQILDAFRRMGNTPEGKPYRPTLSIVVCGKRHNVGTIPNDEDGADRGGNTPAGSVIDQGITSVFDFDFYLQPHTALKGRVKYTHYVVIHDEMSFKSDEIQQGIHTASYLYARTTKAVSLIPAVYYADMACERGRSYLNSFLTGHASGKGRLRDKSEQAQRVFDAATKAWGNGIHAKLKDTMFYL